MEDSIKLQEEIRKLLVKRHKCTIDEVGVVDQQIEDYGVKLLTNLKQIDGWEAMLQRGYKKDYSRNYCWHISVSRMETYLEVINDNADIFNYDEPIILKIHLYSSLEQQVKNANNANKVPISINNINFKKVYLP